MTRIIKKRKVKTNAENETPVVKKAEGKNLQQSGEFFQKNKTVVTWVLVIIFSMTCFGVTSSLFSGCGTSDGNPAQTSGETQQRDAKLETIADCKRTLEQAPNDPLSLANLAYAYQNAAFSFKIKDELNNSKANESAINEYFKNAEIYYKKTLEADPNYAFAAVNLMELYNSLQQYDKSIELGERLYKEKNLASKTISNDVDAQIEEDNFSPIAAKLIIAYSNSGESNKIKEYGAKALELNPNS